MQPKMKSRNKAALRIILIVAALVIISHSIAVMS